MAFGVELVVRALQQNGNIVSEYPAARVTGLRSQLNWWQQATFTLPLDDSGADLFLLPNEAQLLRPDGTVAIWGPVIARRVDHASRLWEYTVAGPLWYFTRRHVGWLQRRDYVTNGDFENGMTGWSTFGTGLTADASTDQAYTGTHSCHLVGTTLDHANRFTRQTFSIQTGQRKVTLNAVAYSWINGAGFVYSAYRNFGLDLYWAAAGRNKYTKVGVHTVRNRWVRHAVSLVLPPNTAATVELRLYGIAGGIYWDQVTAWVDSTVDFVDDTGPGGNRWNTGWVVDELIQGMQGHLVGNIDGFAPTTFPFSQFPWPTGRSDLLIGTDIQATPDLGQWRYRLEDRAVGFADGQSGGVIDDLIRTGAGMDIDAEYSTTQRNITNFVPRKGINWPYDFLYRNVPGSPEVSPNFGIVGWGFADTIDSLRTDLTLLNSAEPPDAAYSQAAASTGGVTLEDVQSADLNSVAHLQDSALAIGGAEAVPQESFTFTLADVLDPIGNVIIPIVGVITVGDTFTATIEDGAFSRSDTFRVMALDEDTTTGLVAATVISSVPAGSAPIPPGQTVGFGQPLADVSYLTTEFVQSHTCRLQIASDPQLGSVTPKGHAYQRQFFITAQGAPNSSVQGGSGYFELQTYASPSAPGALHLNGRRVIVFSIWGGTAATAGTGPNEGAFPTYAGTGAEVGGSLATVMMDFDWVQGETLTLTFTSSGTGTISLFVSGSAHGGTQYLVGQITGIGNGFADTTTLWGWLSHYTRQLDEFYSQGQQPDCSGFGYSVSVWSHFHANSNLSGGTTDIIADYYVLYPQASTPTLCGSTVVRTAVGGDSDTITMTIGA